MEKDLNIEEVASHIESSLRLLFDDGDVFETRLLGVQSGSGRPYTASGYFSDLHRCAAEIAHVDAVRSPSGIYCTLNGVDPTLLARAPNTIVAYARHTTSDADVPRRQNLLIDIDADRRLA